MNNINSLKEFATTVSTWLAYPALDGNFLAAIRVLSVLFLTIAFTATKGQHWTLRTGIFIFIVLLGTDAILGLAPNRLQYLTPAFIGRNVAIILLSYGICILCYSLNRKAKIAKLVEKKKE